MLSGSNRAAEDRAQEAFLSAFRHWDRIGAFDNPGGDVRRVVSGPDGVGYEVLGMAKDWKLGTGSVVLDAAALLWAVVRRSRGKEWIVTVRQADTTSGPFLTRLARTKEDAASSVTELSEAIESGQLHV